MRENKPITVTTEISATATDTHKDKASTRALSSRTRFSGNDIMRIMNALKSAKLDMDDKRFSMNGVIHVVQEEIESLMQTHNCSYAEIARLFASTGCPVSERTLQDYLARARKDAREGRTGYSRIRQLIIESAESAEASESKPAETAIAGQAVPASTAEDGIPATISCPASQEKPCASPASPDSDDMPTPDNGFLEKSVSQAMDAGETADRKREHIQAIYDARNRRKKARQAQKKGQTVPASTAEDGIPVAVSSSASQEATCAAPASPDSDDMPTPDNGFLEKSVSQAMDASEAADRKRRHLIEPAEQSERKPAEPATAGQADPAIKAEPCAAPASPDFDDMPTPDDGFLEKSVAQAMDASEAADRKRQHIQAIYDARKRRKKARLSKKKVQAA